ncbi:MAG: GAF domain-containing protein [Weeksellaceae bacterium]|nr:GAF domain-containing protein [Bacteroidota bacterium]MCG2781641.1 GAF domain-containing protein [Weeksellaceae bacterium]
MQFDQGFDVTPFRFVFSFATLIEQMNAIAGEDKLYASKNRDILEEAKFYPELSEEVDYAYLEDNSEFLKRLLSDIFPPSLTENEIKAVGMPFANFLYNPTGRLRKILDAAGDDFELKFNNLSPEQSYIISCCVILNSYFKINFKPDTTLIYSIPNEEGYLNHYRILTNADFLEIKPTERSVFLSPGDIQELSDHYDHIELWKKKFPPNSWELKGFGVVSFYDATTEVALSNLKGLLIQSKERKETVSSDLNGIFCSIFRSSDIEIGYTEIDLKEKIYKESPINKVIKSKILRPGHHKALLEEALVKTLKEKNYFTISDISKYLETHSDSFLASHYHHLGYQSVILAPVFRHDQLLGVIEVTSSKKILHSVNAHKLDVVMPFLEESINQIYSTLEYQVAALIQREYTSIHPSVYWKFHREALKHVMFSYDQRGKKLPYQSIVFDQVLPHYGQSDIKNSSLLRNTAILLDLQEQMILLASLLNSLETTADLSELTVEVTEKTKKLESGLKADTENEIQRFLTQKVNPTLRKLQSENEFTDQKINSYFMRTEPSSPQSCVHRKRFDESISLINKELTDLIDERQEEQQKIFPFYYERFATDGVEHNLYIGGDIAPWLSYEPVFLRNLRIWQMRVMIESEILFKKTRKNLPLNLDITSLILAYGNSISIRFRMDEKRFDVDGSYNARYEIIKKRIDKSLIKNSDERLVQTGKISIVFAQRYQLEEYMKYISLLQSENLLHDHIEILEIQDLQGITGLKAIRVGINFGCRAISYPFYQDI